MKLVSLALAAAATVAYAQGQPPAKTPDQAPGTYSAPKSHACKKEVQDLCGRRAKGELQSCLKDGIDLNKFSDNCKAEITQPAKSGS